MIPNYQDRQIDSSGVSDIASFGISQENSAHIMNILRDTLYSDKILAVLREYSANAWDAHKMVGKGDIPIKIVIPTIASPILTVEDYGPGMSHDEIFKLYTQYGVSTKRTSNSVVGQLGIGSKSGFAYSDSFTIISRNNGVQRTYVAVLDETEKGVINLLDERDCADKTGVTIQIPVKPEDIQEFTGKAENLFKHFVPRPDINIELPEEIPARARLKSGVVYESESEDSRWIAVMGCIPYRLNLSQIITNENDQTGIGGWVYKLAGILYFDIGEVQISASREELKYSKSTKQAIVKRFSDLADEFVETTLSAIKSKSLSSWERRLRAQILRQFELPVPDEGKELTVSYVDIQTSEDNIAKTFAFVSRDDKVQDRHNLKRFPVQQDTRIVIVDDDRKLSGYVLGYHDLLLAKKQESSWDEVRKELDEYLTKYGLDGVSITNISKLSWAAPFVRHKPRKKANPKYFRKSFVLIPPVSHFRDPFSDHWEPTDPKRVATDADVFVLLDGFRTEKLDGFNIYNSYQSDRRTAEFFGIPMPQVYGYKTSDKKPLKIEDCAGKHYREWRESFLANLTQGKASPFIEIYDWNYSYDRRWNWGRHALNMRELGESLGRDHQIYNYLKNGNKAAKLWRKFSSERQRIVSDLGSRYIQIPGKSKAKDALSAIFDKYPLLSTNDTGISCLWGKHKTQWIEYIMLADNASITNKVKLTPIKTEDERS